MRGREGASDTRDISSAPLRYGNFDLIRLAAAATVLIHHSFPISGQGGDGWVFRRFGEYQIDPGGLAVAVFFVLSGFLIATSWEKEPSWRPYLLKRVARIWPAFVVVLVLTALVLGPLVTTTPLVTYFRSWGTRAYITNNMFFFPMNRQALNGVFFDNPYPAVTNGSLWSLPYEVLAYLAVLVIGFITSARRVVYPALALISLVLVALVNAGVWIPEFHIGPINPNVMVWLSACFFVGASLSFHREWLGRPVVAAVAVAAMALSILTDQPLLFIPGFAVAIIMLGMTSSRAARFVARGGDPSYGLYLYAWPVQQTLTWAGIVGSAWVLTAVALPVALGCGYLSWYLVERPSAGWVRRKYLESNHSSRSVA